MKFKIQKQTFIRDILSPIATLNDRAILSVTQQNISCIVNNSENNVILYSKINIPSAESFELNIGDIKKLIRALDCIEQDEVEFTFNSAYISYDTEAITFKYHLLQPGLIQKHTIDINKVNNLKFNTTFELTCESVQKILKATSFATETNKLYFYTKDKQVYANLTDYTMSQADLIGFRVSEGFSGNELKTELPLNIDTFKLLQLSKNNKMIVNVNSDLKIMVFNISTELYELKYIVSGLVK